LPNLRNRADSVRLVSAQAFCKARYKISALVFGDVNRKLMDLVEEHLPVPRWQGLRIVASDTAAVRLTTMKEGVRSIVTGVAFGLYLPGIEMFLHFALQHGACDERQMLFEVIERLQVDDLLVLDRGFPCRWLAAALTARGIPFCIRCDISRGFRVVREFMRSGQSEQLGEPACAECARCAGLRVPGDADNGSLGAGDHAERAATCGDDFAA
jgi:hypothetical protein